jgi:geranylgeranyl transferase type-2 subunit beta
VYWGLTALCLLGEPNALDREETIKYVLSCQTEEGNSRNRAAKAGGFGAHAGHDPHIIYTLSAIQILAIQDALSAIDHETVIKCILLLNPDNRHNLFTK